LETREETLSRIAYGVFGTFKATTNVGTSVGDNGGPFNATTSGGDDYSPQHDDFTFGMDA
jgi:hypothetical protein